MDLALILKKKYNNHIWTIDGNSYAGINWLSDTEKPSEEELLSHWDSVLSEVEAEAQAKAAKKAAVNNFAKENKIPVAIKEVSNPKYKGKIMMYPKSFLEVYFEDK